MILLTGYHLSVYTRSVRLALAVKGVDYAYAECDPFDESCAGALRAKHPFGRVPVLDDDGFRIYETSAILEHVAMLPGASLVPDAVRGRVRMRQVMAIADNYLYWPCVRQAASNAVFAPLWGEAGDSAALRAGLAAAPVALDALEEIAAEGLSLGMEAVTLADCHLLPMLDYFQMVPDGARMIAARPAISTWLAWGQARPEAVATRPNLPDGAKEPTA